MSEEIHFSRHHRANTGTEKETTIWQPGWVGNLFYRFVSSWKKRIGKLIEANVQRTMIS
jgi:hypothetical protein